jgi:hypothetical protein
MIDEEDVVLTQPSLGGPEGPLEARTARRVTVSVLCVFYPSKRRSTTQALWPPKPNEFETATRTSASRASFGM